MFQELMFRLTNVMMAIVAWGNPGGLMGDRPTGGGGTTVQTPANGGGAAAGGGTAAGGAEGVGGMGMGPMLVWVAVLLIAMYFLMFRGPKKREKKMKEMQASIRTGDNVVVTGGMFGKISDVGEDCFIVEFGQNRGIRIPVLKSDVLGIREPKLTPPPKVIEDKEKEKEKDKEK